MNRRETDPDDDLAWTRNPAYRAALDALKMMMDAAQRGASATDIAILRDEMLLETIGSIPDDPIMAQFRSLVPMAREFLTTRGQPGTHAKATKLVEQTFDAVHELGVHGAVQQVFYGAVRGDVDGAGLDRLPEDMNVEHLEAGTSGLLRGEAALHDLVTSRLLSPEHGRLLAQDALYQSMGDESLLGRQVRQRRRQNRLSTLVGNLRARSVLRSHYEAGRDGCGWEAAHERLFPGVAALETIRDWNKLADPDMRRTARTAGEKTGKQLALDAREQAMEDHVLHDAAEDIARGLRENKSRREGGGSVSPSQARKTVIDGQPSTLWRRYSR